MTSLLACIAVLSLSNPPDDFVEPPMLEISGPPPCNTDRDCFGNQPLCDTNTGECVECLGPEHCDEGWTCVPSGHCLDACEVDGDCEGVGGQDLCNPETGTCVECLGTEDCAEWEYCDDYGTCRSDHCTPGETFCFGGSIVQCLRDGGSTMALETCPEICADVEGGAECVTPGDSSGDPGSTSAPGDTTAGGGGTTSPGDGSGPGSGPGTEGGTPPAEDDGAKGCACRSTGAPAGWAASWTVLLLAAGARRRRRSGARR